MATGRKGTGWMIYSKGDRLTNGPGGRRESIDEYANGWLETLQWKYEVGDKIMEALEKKGISGDTHDERFPDAYLDLETAWIAGYADRIAELDPKQPGEAD